MNVKVNEALLRGYLEALQHIAEEYHLPNDASALSVSRFPDVLTVEKKDLDADAISAGILGITENALQDFDAMRLHEGESCGRMYWQGSEPSMRWSKPLKGKAPKPLPSTERGWKPKWRKFSAVPV